MTNNMSEVLIGVNSVTTKWPLLAANNRPLTSLFANV